MSRNQLDLVYLLVGDGATRPELEACVKARRLTNVRFLPVLRREEFMHMLAAIDVALITQRRSVADIVFPSKTVTLMAAGCPIVASVNSNSEVARVLQQSGGGCVVAPENPERLLGAITRLQRESGTLQAMGEAGRRHARQHWDEEITLPRMEADLLRVAGRSGSGERVAFAPEPSRRENSQPTAAIPGGCL